MLPLYIAGAVALICFILYALDRRFRSESIDWMTAIKITVVGGLLGGGVAYAISTPEVAETVAAPAQEMFVGVPTF